MIAARYTLERHLEEYCKQDGRFGMLHHAYRYNKRQICEVLDSVKLHFPHFSKHGTSHSECIITSIESFLGEDRIKSLSASDTFLILLAAYLHDIGMYLTNEEIRGVWMTDEFHEFVDRHAETDESAAFVKNFYDTYDGSVSRQSEYLLDLVGHTRVVYAEYFRRSHGEKGAERIRNNLRELDIFVDAGQFIPKRLVRLLSVICSSHNDDFRDLMSNLPHKQSSNLGDMLHPRFIAVLLRLGDLLDMDNNRFDELAVESTGELNPVSRIHYDKHNSVEELLITPELIEAVSVSEDVAVLKEAKRWMNWIEAEIAHFRDHWHQIVPAGTAGTVPKFSYRVKRRNSEVPFEDKDLKLVLPPEKAFDIIIGSHIYKDRFIFLRELIQNATDALKRQLWRDLRRSADPSRGSADLPYALPEEVFAAYRVNIHFYDIGKRQNDMERFIAHVGEKAPKLLQTNSARGGKTSASEIVVVIEDNGTGISLEDFQNRILQVGKKTGKPTAYAKETSAMPQWLQPTGTFGIGLHSVFQVTEQIVIQTRAESDAENGREIYIQSGKQGGYVYSDKWDCGRTGGRALNRGTRVIIPIDSRDHMPSDSQTPILNPGSFRSEPKDYVIQYMENAVESAFDGAKQTGEAVAGIQYDYWTVPVFSYRHPSPFSGLEYARIAHTEDDNFYSEILGIGVKPNVLRDHSAPVIFVYDKRNHHRLWFSPVTAVTSEQARDSAIDLAYKGVQVRDEQLKRRLADLLYGRDKLRIDYAHSRTREYLQLDRDRFLNDKHDELVSTAYDMLEAAIGHYQAFLTERFRPNSAIFNLYNDLNRMLLEVLEEAFGEFVEIHQKKKVELINSLALLTERFANRSKTIRRFVQSNGADVPHELLYLLFAKRMYHWLHLLKGVYWPQFQNSAELLPSLNPFIADYLNAANACIGGELGEQEYRDIYMQIVHRMAGGNAIFYPHMLSLKDSHRNPLPAYATYLNAANATKMYLYHLRFGHVASLDEEYRQALGVLSDAYIYDDEYGYYSDPSANEGPNPLLFICSDATARRAYFGSEAVLLHRKLYFPLDLKNDRIRAFKPIRQLSVRTYRNSSYYYYDTASEADAGRPVAMELLDGAASYMYSELIRYDYTDVEEMGWLPFPYEYYVLPALKPYPELAVQLHSATNGEGANRQRELRIISARSKFGSMKQGSHLLVPFSEGQMEQMIKFAMDLSFQLSQQDAGERRKLREQILKSVREAALPARPMTRNVYDSLSDLLRYLQVIYKSDTFANMARFNAEYAVARGSSDPSEYEKVVIPAMKRLAQDILLHMCDAIL